MQVKDAIRFSLWDTVQNEWVDISEGVLSINTKTGVDYFQGFWDVVEPGQITVVSRNELLDPYANNLIRQNAIIKVHAIRQNPYWTPESQYVDPLLDKVIFLGFITDFNVEYRKDDFPLITINGTDVLGLYNRYVITEDIYNNEILPEYPDGVVPINYLLSLATDPDSDLWWYIGISTYYTNRSQGGLVSVYTLDDTPNAPKVKVEIGKTFLELINEGISTGLMEYASIGGTEFRFYPYFKYDSSYWEPYNSYIYNWSGDYFAQSEPGPNLENDGIFNYKFITINDGFDRMVNLVAVSNTDPETGTSQTFDPIGDQALIDEWGPANISASTVFNTQTNSMLMNNPTIAEQAERYQADILEFQAAPELSINSITIDMIKQYWSLDHSANLHLPGDGAGIEINHKINETTNITGKFQVCGTRHIITPDSWMCELITRKFKEPDLVAANIPKTPKISITPYTIDTEYAVPAIEGTTATNFTATVTNYTTEDWAKVERIEWMVNQPWYNYIAYYGLAPSQYKSLEIIPQYLYDWSMFDNAPIFTGQSVTWNYDDGGPLNGYPHYMLGPGQYSVVCWITNTDGYTVRGVAEYAGQDNGEALILNIYGAQAHADFSFTKNASEEVTFVDASGPDTNTWSWDFGDGTTYNGKYPPVKKYTNTGTYNVTLTVDNGYATASITKQVTVTYYTLNVRYIRLRLQGTVTKAAGAADYTTDIIDTFGHLRLQNLSGTETGGNNPIYCIPRTIDKVLDLAATTWVGTNDLITTYNPVYRTNYNSGGPLDPMSQSYGSTNVNPNYISTARELPKYKFLPVITNNPDGSQTKTLDVDLIIEYSQRILVSPMPDFFDGKRSPVLPYRPAGNPTYLRFWNEWDSNLEKRKLNAIRFYPGSDLIITGKEILNTTSTVTNWTGPLYYGSAGSPIYAASNLVTVAAAQGVQFYVGQTIEIRYTADGTLADSGTITQIGGTGLQYTTNSINNFANGSTGPFNVTSPTTYANGTADRMGIKQGKTYLPISVAVSEDGITYRKVADLTFNSAGTVPGYPSTGTADELTATYLGVMPPMNSLAVEP